MRPLAIELAFDEDSDRRLRQVWSRLSQLYDRPADSELGLAPHITLAVFRRGEPKSVWSLVEDFAEGVAPFGLNLAKADRFPTSEGVVFLEPEPAADLTRAHTILHQRLGADRELVDPYYRPEAWHPHCTMAIQVAEPLVETVLAACRSSEGLGRVLVTRIQVVRYRPATEVARALLARCD